MFYIIIITFSIPWYWPSETNIIFYGFPVWVIVAIIGSLIASCFTVFLLLQPDNNNE